MENKRIFGMILAAGLGTRLRPLTEKTPKPAVIVGEKPLIFYALQNMERAGVARVVINTHYLSELVRNAVLSYSWPFEIVFLHEAEILGTGGAILNAKFRLRNCDAILIHNSDAIVECDLGSLLLSHFTNNPLATMLLKKVEDPDEFGAVTTDQFDLVRDIIGAVGYLGPIAQRRMFCGVQVLSPEIFKWMPPRGSFCILRNVLIPAIQSGAQVRGVDHPGFFCDVGTKERLEQANHHFSKLAHENISFDSI